MSEYFFVLVFTGLAAVLVGVALITARLIAPRGWTLTKGMPYECGEKTIGRTWIQFNVGYYLFALLFLVFDVEAAFLYPWALVFREVGVAGLVEIGIFVFVLLVGLAYAWRKGALEWV
jgi:NADH-quinone oxidoreductase subunit A